MKYSYLVFLIIFLPVILGVSGSVLSSSEKELALVGNDLKEHFAGLVYVEGGEFAKGFTSNFDPGPSDSLLLSSYMPSRAFVDDYFMSTTEITNLEWKLFYHDKVQELGRVKAKEQFYPDTSLWLNEFKYTSNRPHAKNYFSHPRNNNFPVVGITWDQANSYCQWKSKQVNSLLVKKGKKSKVEFRLPTENEWEFAALQKLDDRRIQERSVFCWPEDKMLNQINNLVNIGEIFDQNGVRLKAYADDGCLYPCEVGTYPPNEKGFYNMAGNVSEWTADQGHIRTNFFENYTSRTLSTNDEIEAELTYLRDSLNVKDRQVELLVEKLEHDKKILLGDHIKICKGGSWTNGLIYAQPGSRQGVGKDEASVKIGFRIAISKVDEELIKYFEKGK